MQAAVVVVALSLAPALAASQSLGDAARRQAGERPKQTQPARIYTEADLHGKEDTPAGAAEDPLAPSKRADADAVTATGGAKGESEEAVRARLDREAEARQERELAWRGAARAALARVADAQRGYAAVCGSGAAVLTGG